MLLLEHDHFAATPNALDSSHSTRLPQTEGPPKLIELKRDTLADEELVALCKKELPHTLASYEELVRRYEAQIFNYCNRFLNSHLDAEEICQDAFLRVFHKIHQFEGRSSFKTWLYRIVTNLCLGRRSTLAKRRERQALYSAEATTQADAAIAETTNPEIGEHLQQAMAKLDAEKRQIITLKFISGLSLQEISEILKISLSATKMRLYRARDELKEAYLHTSGQALAA